MYPYPLFGVIDLYWIFIIVGVLGAFLFLRIFSSKLNIPAKVFNFLLLNGILTVVVGYLFAILFQDFYHLIDTGEWSWNAGATFYGGLIGGTLFFILFYLFGGKLFFKDNSHISYFPLVVNCVLTVVALGHAFGRIGCLMDGCCYGQVTDSWIGIHMYFDPDGVKRIPTQLLESLFLFMLFGVLTYFLVKRKNEYIASIYMISYGIWRFTIEYFRGDAERGSLGSSYLWPSQIIAIVLVIAGIGLIFLYKFFLRNFFLKFDNNEKEN